MFAESSPHPLWATIADLGLKGTALLVGGLWTYIQYRRTHPYRQKPEVEAEGQFYKRNGNSYLKVRCAMKNVGQSEYLIEKGGTAFLAWAINPDQLQDFPQPFEGLSVFTEHTKMEAGTRIQDSIVVEVPPEIKVDHVILFRIGLTVRVSGKIRWYRRLPRWILLKLLADTMQKESEGFKKGMGNIEVGDYFGENFSEIFGRDFEGVFERDFREVFGESLESILRRRAQIPVRFKRLLFWKSLRWWRFLWSLCNVEYTKYRTNCLIEPLDQMGVVQPRYGISISD